MSKSLREQLMLIRGSISPDKKNDSKNQRVKIQTQSVSNETLNKSFDLPANLHGYVTDFGKQTLIHSLPNDRTKKKKTKKPKNNLLGVGWTCHICGLITGLEGKIGHLNKEHNIYPDGSTCGTAKSVRATFVQGGSPGLKGK